MTKKLEYWDIEKFVEYDGNPRKNDHAVDKMAEAIRAFGFRVPILAKSNGMVVDGHLRLKAARKVGLTELPVINADDLTDVQVKAFRISVNKMADLAEWDEKLLGEEFAALKDLGFDLALTGFTVSEVGGFIRPVDLGDNNPYTAKIEAPIYTPKEEQKPKISELYDDSKTKALVAKIKASDLSASEKAFLILAAQRHTSFNFKAIAEFYAHSDKDVQEFMEESALVIIDFNKAIELGYVDLTDALSVQFSEDRPPQVTDEAEDEADE